MGSCFLFARRIIWFTSMAHTPVYWAALAIFIYTFMYSENMLLHAFCFSLCIGLRPTAFILFSFLLLYYFKRYNIKTAFGFLGFSLLFFGVIILPFYISTPTEFYNATVKSYLHLGNYVWEFNKDWVLNTFGFTGILYYLGLNKLIPLLFVSTQIILILLAYFRIRDKADCLVFMALGMLFSSFFMSVPWIYLYFSSCLLLSFAAIFNLLSNSHSNLTEYIQLTETKLSHLMKWYIITFISGVILLIALIITYPETTHLEFTDPSAGSQMHKGWSSIELIQVPAGNTLPAITMTETKSDISFPLSFPKNRKIILRILVPVKEVELDILVNNKLANHIQINHTPYLQEIRMEVPQKYFILGNNVISFKLPPDSIKSIYFYSMSI